MRLIRKAAPILLAALAACHRTAPAVAVPSFALTVLTAADTAPNIVTVTVRSDDGSQVVPLTRTAPNRFTAVLPPGTAQVALDLSVPEHVPLRTTLWLPTDGPADIIIRPRALVPRKTITTLRVLGDFNNFDDDSAVTLKPDERGRLRAAVPFKGDSSRFHILGFGGGSRGAWIPVSSYATTPNPYGPPIYAGTLRSVRDSLVFEVDTSLPRRLTPAPRITMRTRDSLALLANQLLLDRADAWSASDAVQWWRDSGSTSIRDEGILRAKALLASATDPRVRGTALVTILTQSGKQADSMAKYGAILLREFPPGTNLSRDRDGLDAFGDAIGSSLFDSTLTDTARARIGAVVVRQVRDYLLPIARGTADSSNRINAWLRSAYILQSTRDTAALYGLIDEAMAAMPTNRFVSKLPAAMGRAKILRAGAIFPTFRMAAIGGGPELTNEVFTRSKYTLVDFWGVWCPPCVFEMPVLHKAHDRFKDRGFTILSLSTDPAIATVEKFRQDKRKMPWINGWMGPQGNDSPAITTLGVMEFPLAVLVDSAGKIVAVTEGLRGGALEVTLGKLLP